MEVAMSITQDSRFTVEIDGEYGVNEGAIRLMTYGHELVMWDSAEWVEDPSLMYVIVNAIRIGFAEGPEAIRRRLKIIGPEWTEVDELIEDAGQVGGDVQVSSSCNRRFICLPDPGKTEYHVLDFYSYWAITNLNGEVDDPDEPRRIQMQVNYTVCTDPNDVGGSEISSDIRYWDNQDEDEMDTPRNVCARLTKEDLNEATDQMGV